MRSWGWLFASLLFSIACTKPNPAKHCTDGTCTTPAYPFCDVTGAIGGEEGTCIAVTCAAGEFGECRGDAEVRCSANEHNYDVVQCERGCDPAADGCRLCNPNETACTNGKVVTCDANGVVTAMTACPLGCFEDEARCREIDPSNGLGAYLDMVVAPPDIEIEDGAVNTNNGEIRLNPSNALLDVPNFLLPAPQGGVPVRVFVVNHANIQRLNILEDGPAFALVARGDITITANVVLSAGVGISTYAGCTGGLGDYYQACGDATSGGGGGANATNGASGGSIPNFNVGGSAGIAAGSPKLVPLVGGCSGGGINGAEQGTASSGGRGGGAAQFTSRTKVLVDGIVNANGEPGFYEMYAQTSGYIVNGGGAGGSLLIEAPLVELGPNAKLLAAGGDGAAPCSTATQQCGVAGNGAHANMAASNGGDASCLGSTSIRKTTGGGGGGLGRIRINTADANYIKSSSSVEDGALTTGIITTR